MNGPWHKVKDLGLNHENIPEANYRPSSGSDDVGRYMLVSLSHAVFTCKTSLGDDGLWHGQMVYGHFMNANLLPVNP